MPAQSRLQSSLFRVIIIHTLKSPESSTQRLWSSKSRLVSGKEQVVSGESGAVTPRDGNRSPTKMTEPHSNNTVYHKQRLYGNLRHRGGIAAEVRGDELALLVALMPFPISPSALHAGDDRALSLFLLAVWAVAVLAVMEAAVAAQVVGEVVVKNDMSLSPKP